MGCDTWDGWDAGVAWWDGGCCCGKLVCETWGAMCDAVDTGWDTCECAWDTCDGMFTGAWDTCDEGGEASLSGWACDTCEWYVDTGGVRGGEFSTLLRRSTFSALRADTSSFWWSMARRTLSSSALRADSLPSCAATDEVASRKRKFRSSTSNVDLLIRDSWFASESIFSCCALHRRRICSSDEDCAFTVCCATSSSSGLLGCARRESSSSSSSDFAFSCERRSSSTQDSLRAWSSCLLSSVTSDVSLPMASLFVFDTPPPNPPMLPYSRGDVGCGLATCCCSGE